MAFKLNIGLLALSLSLSLVNLDGASAGMPTRYWDCCVASASWQGKAPVYAPVDVCEADGVTVIDAKDANSGRQSGCNGGNMYMCSCQQPFDDETDPTLALGFAAFTTGQEADTDCACYYAEFSGDEQGKPMKKNKLIFQVTNVGGDVQSGNIDFQIPGGGLGAFTQGCPKQWKDSASDWGETFGGVKSADQCSNLPKPLQDGCKWRFTSWGNNPKIEGKPKRVKCPKSLIDRSGCQRKDDNTVSPYSGKVDPSNGPAPAQYKRDRSVCMGGGKKQSYGPGPATGGEATIGTVPGGADGAGEQGKPEGYGANPGGAVAGTNADGSNPAPGANADANNPAPGPDGAQEGYGAPTPGSDDHSHGHGHKKHNVCKRSH